MDENTSIKFFARRNEMKQKMDQLRKRADNLVEEMAKQIKDGGIKDDKYVKTNAASLFNINREMIKTREDFVNNLFDLLSVEQVAKFLIFEKRFREEIRELIFRQDE
ncbi:MAG: hypothetical protein IAE91_12675 [Ignavibacteriaceae bacterium]|nr:hypothetical protein [Ignavibacteriaceae bacterium]